MPRKKVKLSLNPIVGFAEDSIFGFFLRIERNEEEAMFFYDLAKYTDFKPSYLLQESRKSRIAKKLDSISFMNWFLYKARELYGRVPDEDADISGALRGFLMKVLGFHSSSGVQKQYKRVRLFQR